MQVSLFLKDLTKSTYPCRLRFKIEGFGITIQSKNNNFYVAPLSLNGGELSTFSGADLEPYLNPKNLIFQGLDQTAFSRKGVSCPKEFTASAWRCWIITNAAWFPITETPYYPYS